LPKAGDKLAGKPVCTIRSVAHRVRYKDVPTEFGVPFFLGYFFFGQAKKKYLARGVKACNSYRQPGDPGNLQLNAKIGCANSRL
jgi:hypothetical protein